eukprot:4980819-Pyramimonas_sp.AAC.1
MGPRSAALGGGDACGLRHWDPRWGSRWRHMRPRNIVLRVGDACGLRRWGTRWTSFRVHEPLYWVWDTHAGCATATFGGAPYGATKR